MFVLTVYLYLLRHKLSFIAQAQGAILVASPGEDRDPQRTNFNAH